VSDIPADRASVFDWRLKQQEEATKSLRHWRGNTDMKLVAQEGKLEQLHEDVKDVGRQVAGIRRLLIGLMSSITVAVVIFALSLLTATGRL
jgi:hypothetical protein